MRTGIKVIYNDKEYTVIHYIPPIVEIRSGEDVLRVYEWDLTTKKDS